MPIPPELLSAMLSLSVEWGDDPPGWASGAWGIPAWDAGRAPDDPAVERAELEKRLRQSGRRWRAVSFSGGGLRVSGIVSPDLDRAGAIRLGYRLRRWAVFRVHEAGLDPVFTGINSRL